MDQHVWMPIEYRDFYDRPRMFKLTVGDQVFLCISAFKEDLDDHDSAYEVWRITSPEAISWGGSWLEFPRPNDQLMGRIAVKDVVFDASCRASVDLRSLEAMVALRQ